jgi:molecular chaperone GrpE (heat shock protein)
MQEDMQEASRPKSVWRALLARLLANGSDPSPDLPQTGWKAEALRDFCTWLMDLPDDPPSELTDPEPKDDLYGMLAQLTGVKNEVRLHGREQARLSRALEGTGSALQQVIQVLDERTADLKRFEEHERTKAENRCILAFLEVRDALVRGCAAARKIASPGLFGRRARGQAVLDGYLMAIERFDAVLRQLGVQPIVTHDARFDPRTMVAQEARAVPGMSAGWVVEELLEGFLRWEQVLRPAEVVASRDELGAGSASGRGGGEPG